MSLGRLLPLPVKQGQEKATPLHRLDGSLEAESLHLFLSAQNDPTSGETWHIYFGLSGISRSDLVLCLEPISNIICLRQSSFVVFEMVGFSSKRRNSGPG